MIEAGSTFGRACPELIDAAPDLAELAVGAIHTSERSSTSRCQGAKDNLGFVARSDPAQFLAIVVS